MTVKTIGFPGIYETFGFEPKYLRMDQEITLKAAPPSGISGKTWNCDIIWVLLSWDNAP